MQMTQWKPVPWTLHWIHQLLVVSDGLTWCYSHWANVLYVQVRCRHPHNGIDWYQVQAQVSGMITREFYQQCCDYHTIIIISKCMVVVDRLWFTLESFHCFLLQSQTAKRKRRRKRRKVKKSLTERLRTKEFIRRLFEQVTAMYIVECEFHVEHGPRKIFSFLHHIYITSFPWIYVIWDPTWDRTMHWIILSVLWRPGTY